MLCVRILAEYWPFGTEQVHFTRRRLLNFIVDGKQQFMADVWWCDSKWSDYAKCNYNILNENHGQWHLSHTLAVDAMKSYLRIAYLLWHLSNKFHWISISTCKKFKNDLINSKYRLQSKAEIRNEWMEIELCTECASAILAHGNRWISEKIRNGLNEFQIYLKMAILRNVCHSKERSKQQNDFNENNELENASSFPLFREFLAPNEFYFVVERTYNGNT